MTCPGLGSAYQGEGSSVATVEVSSCLSMRAAASARRSGDGVERCTERDELSSTVGSRRPTGAWAGSVSARNETGVVGVALASVGLGGAAVGRSAEELSIAGASVTRRDGIPAISVEVSTDGFF